MSSKIKHTIVAVLVATMSLFTVTGCGDVDYGEKAKTGKSILEARGFDDVQILRTGTATSAYSVGVGKCAFVVKYHYKPSLFQLTVSKPDGGDDVVVNDPTVAKLRDSEDYKYEFAYCNIPQSSSKGEVKTS